MLSIEIFYNQIVELLKATMLIEPPPPGKQFSARLLKILCRKGRNGARKRTPWKRLRSIVQQYRFSEKGWLTMERIHVTQTRIALESECCPETCGISPAVSR